MELLWCCCCCFAVHWALQCLFFNVTGVGWKITGNLDPVILGTTYLNPLLGLLLFKFVLIISLVLPARPYFYQVWPFNRFEFDTPVLVSFKSNKKEYFFLSFSTNFAGKCQRTLCWLRSHSNNTWHSFGTFQSCPPAPHVTFHFFN